MNTMRLLMIPSVALAGWIGVAYMFGDPTRTATPSFGVARSLAPMWAWGGLFMIGAVSLTATTLMGNRRLIGIALFVGGAIYTWWGALLLVTALIDVRAGLAAAALYLFVGSVHFTGSWRFITGQLGRTS